MNLKPEESTYTPVPTLIVFGFDGCMWQLYDVLALPVRSDDISVCDGYFEIVTPDHDEFEIHTRADDDGMMYPPEIEISYPQECSLDKDDIYTADALIYRFDTESKTWEKYDGN
jgi:hypothetical protein